ncbi:MAG: VPEID-CTERM sorting domain-containing protein [Methylomicrobium sp.]
MKMRQIITGGMVVLLTMGSSHAWSNDGPHFRPYGNSYGNSYGKSFGKPNGVSPFHSSPSNKRGSDSGWSHGGSSVYGGTAPEIDAASGTSALALLAGILLLASERRRSKRS